MKHHLTNLDVALACERLASNIRYELPKGGALYGVPRGGIPVLYMVLRELARLNPTEVVYTVTDDPETADGFVDDLVDSGGTRERYLTKYGPLPWFAAFDKELTGDRRWLVFPWEQTEEKSIEDSFVRLLQYIGEDPKRGGLLETPARMAKAWKHWSSGYGRDPVALLKTFEDGAEGYGHGSTMVHVVDIPFYSQCEHHLAPFFGKAAFAYIPDKRVVGLSKMNRLVDMFARRLQVQERLTVQVIDAFCDHIQPLGAGILVTARHLCVESRGVQHSGCATSTSAFRGALLTEPAARAEFFSLCQVTRP